MHQALRQKLERYFAFREHNTTWRTELLAGLTTFVTMAYIVFVNPQILNETGMPIAAVTIATCLCAAFGSILMGALANLPLALAPGMGLNAYFTYSVVLGMHVPWPVALGAVFLSGVLFLLLTATGLRQQLVAAIPQPLHAAVAGGIGLFIAFIGLLIAILQSLRVKAAMLFGVLATLAAGIVCHQVQWHPATLHLADLHATAFHLDVRGALHLNALEIVFVFLFVDLFDNIGTLVAVTQSAGLIRPDGHIPRLSRIFFADATATVAGSLLGTSTVTSYIESAAGVAAGGRTGVTAITTGVLFLVALLIAPLAGAIPSFATAPALILVGALMVAALLRNPAARADWAEPRVAIPAFLTLITIPLTYSIATGLSLGIIAYAALEVFTGRFARAHWMLYALATLFLARLVWMKP